MFHFKEMRKKRTLKKICNKYGYHPVEIHANGNGYTENIPSAEFDICLFENLWAPAYLSVYDLRPIVRNTTEDEFSKFSIPYHNLKTAMQEYIESGCLLEKRREIEKAFQEVLSQELQCGLVRVMQHMEPLDDSAVVKSYRGEQWINYSPMLFLPTEWKETYSVAAHAAFFTDIFTKNKMCCSFWKVYFDHEIQESEVPVIYQMTEEIMEEINDRNVEDYAEMKNDEEYQHRCDW